MLWTVGLAIAPTTSLNAQSVYATPHTVITLAGTAGPGGAVDATGAAARFNLPSGAAVDAAGNIYVSDGFNHTIRKITPAGSVTTLAGTAGSSGSADGTGSAARFNLPHGVAVDSSGNVYVADWGNHTVRKITPAGVVTTLAGTAGSPGSVDGTGSAARFNATSSVAVDSSNNVYVADYGNSTIRKITPAGVVTTFAGSAGLTQSTDGTGSAARFNHPAGVAVDGSNNVYVADYGNSTIRKITSAGVVTTLAGSASGTGSTDGIGSAARFYLPSGVGVDSSGTVYVADYYNHTIRKITTAGAVTTLAGTALSTGSTNGVGSAVRFNFPSSVGVDGSGNLYITEAANNTLRKSVPIPEGFDVVSYLARYPDVAAIYGTNLLGAWLYYRDHGIYAGEIFDELFRGEQYLGLYPDLLAAYGTNLSAVLLHWLEVGRIEGRLGRIPAEFSAAGYFARNPDVAAAVNSDLVLGWQHFWNFGIYEGRAYDDEFRVFEYLALNADLQATFLSDWRGATLHWMRYGRTEGRLGRLPVIFNASYYASLYPEITGAWGTAPTTLWQHFWLYGIDEGKVFDNEFRVDEYLALNVDLQAIFGTNRRGALLHWIRFGRAEGRPGKNP